MLEILQFSCNQIKVFSASNEYDYNLFLSKIKKRYFLYKDKFKASTPKNFLIIFTRKRNLKILKIRLFSCRHRKDFLKSFLLSTIKKIYCEYLTDYLYL